MGAQREQGGAVVVARRRRESAEGGTGGVGAGEGAIRHRSMFFVKKSWHIIREDICELCSYFYNHKADLKSINFSFITLVLRNNPENINDFSTHLFVEYLHEDHYKVAG
jgi:hypothetical protein